MGFACFWVSVTISIVAVPGPTSINLKPSVLAMAGGYMKRDSAARASALAAANWKNSRLDSLLIASHRLFFCALQPCVLFDRSHDRIFAGRADHPFNFLAVREENQGRNSLDAIRGCDRRIVVDVEL